jgi:hypothetical protein
MAPNHARVSLLEPSVPTSSAPPWPSLIAAWIEPASSSRSRVNIFHPSFKLKSKERVGAKIKKTYYPPATPAQRLRVHAAISPQVTARLEQLVTELDPVRLLMIIRDAQAHD